MGNNLRGGHPEKEDAARVVIVGASFAGLFLTRKLIKLLGAAGLG